MEPKVQKSDSIIATRKTEENQHPHSRDASGDLEEALRHLEAAAETENAHAETWETLANLWNYHGDHLSNEFNQSLENEIIRQFRIIERDYRWVRIRDIDTHDPNEEILEEYDILEPKRTG